MQPDLWFLYQLMFASRIFEQAVARLWHAGQISGEMHLGIGEEAICAGIVPQLIEGDAMALDHRGTPPLLMRGVDPVALLREFLGRSDGLCAGMGGHMHLYSPEHLAASSGIVGASGPAAVGFALAGQYLRPGTIAVAFFGEGATNQGMLLESLNLAVVWNLPVLFVCKDNQWAILTDTRDVIGGQLVERARGFGMEAALVDGGDVTAVWQTARTAIQRAREGGGPTFLHARCVHLEGHFIGDPYLRFVRQPLAQLKQFSGPFTRAILAAEGLSRSERLAELRETLGLIRQGQPAKKDDPIRRARSQLIGDYERLKALETQARADITQIVDRALQGAVEGSEA